MADDTEAAPGPDDKQPPAARRSDERSSTVAAPGDLEAWTLRSSNLADFVKSPASSDAGANGQVLVIMNEPELGLLLFYCLTAAGFRARLANRDTDGARDVRREFPDVVLLDSRLPGRRSTDVWRTIRAVSGGERPPAVIMLIGGEDDIDPRLGLDFGTCDFVVYALSVRDLVLRVDRIVRLRRDVSERTRPPRRRGCYLVGSLELDLDRHAVRVDGAPVAVSPMELRVLGYLIEHRDRVCSRNDLFTDVWGYRGAVASRATDIHINRLRTKLGAAGALIETLRGAGYRLSTEFPVLVSSGEDPSDQKASVDAGRRARRGKPHGEPPGW